MKSLTRAMKRCARRRSCAMAKSFADRRQPRSDALRASVRMADLGDIREHAGRCERDECAVPGTADTDKKLAGIMVKKGDTVGG